MSRASTLLFATALGACALPGSSTRSEQRYHNSEQGFSVDEPGGWSPSLVRGAAQFASSDPNRRKHAIVVRSIQKSRELKEGVPATRDELFSATEKVLRALPAAELSSKHVVEGSELPAMQFSLVYQPRGLKTPYRREHVTLVGTFHLFHVIYSAPANEPVDEVALRSIVASLSEEK